MAISGSWGAAAAAIPSTSQDQQSRADASANSCSCATGTGNDPGKDLLKCEGEKARSIWKEFMIISAAKHGLPTRDAAAGCYLDVTALLQRIQSLA